MTKARTPYQYPPPVERARISWDELMKDVDGPSKDLQRIIAIGRKYALKDGEYRINGLGRWLAEWLDRLGVRHDFTRDLPRMWWWRRMLRRDEQHKMWSALK